VGRVTDTPSTGEPPRPNESQPPPPPPPPPPADLSVPPGYVAYDQQPSTGTLSRVGGLTSATVILTGIVGVLSLATALLQGLARDDARDYLAGTISEDDFIEAYLPSAGVGLLVSLAQVATVVLTMILLFRLAKNVRALGRRTTWAPGWAIGGWFLPPLVLYVIPYLMLRELWKASDPDVAAGDERWKHGSVGAVVTAWWVLFGLIPLVLVIIQGANAIGGGLAAGDTEALAEMVTDQYALTVVSGVVTLLAAIAYIGLLRGLVDRHRRLTGEAGRT